MKSEVFLLDCMEGMRNTPDKFYQLAIVDPPYGITQPAFRKGSRNKAAKTKEYNHAVYRQTAPDRSYFNELFRVSKNQIVWGANYMTNFLPIKMGWIFWDKCVAAGCSFSDGELAWTSFNQALKKVVIPYSGFIGMEGEKFHPTTKPIKLYSWLLHKYAQPDFKIIDTHAGSFSIGIAAHDFGCELTACEIDKDYFNDSVKRFRLETAQTKLFTAA